MYAVPGVAEYGQCPQSGDWPPRNAEGGSTEMKGLGHRELAVRQGQSQ